MREPRAALYGRIEAAQAERLVDSIAARYPDKTGRLLNTLNDVQESCRFIPGEAIDRIAETMGVPAEQIVRMADFFSYLTLEPVGRCVIDVCDGTACHTKGAARLVSEFEKKLGVEVGQTTEDGLFTLRTVGCVGACGLAPVVVVDGDAFGRVRVTQVGDLAALAAKRVQDGEGAEGAAPAEGGAQ